jgi:hypothetical protein
MDLGKLLAGQFDNEEILETLGKTVGVDSGKAGDLAKLGIPAIMQALSRNASTPEGANALNKALEDHRDDDVDNIAEFLGKRKPDEAARMLDHIFAGSNDRVKNNLAKQTGLDAGQVSGLLAQLAPLLIGALGQQKKQQNVDASGLAGLLGGLAGSSGAGGLMDLAAKLLDTDQDGSIMDNVGDLLSGFLKK